MTERADSLVNNRSPRYLHGFQKDTNETTELPHTVPVGNQVTYTDSFTNYGVDTVYGKEYVIAAGSPPTVHNSLPGRSDTDTHPASSITNTPAGNIAATTVQDAINELDSEKGGLATNNTWVGSNTFTQSLAALQFVKSGGTSGQFLKADGSVDSSSYETTITAGTTSQYYRGDKTWQALDTVAVTESTNLYFTNARVLSTVLTGLNTSLAGTVSASDTILAAIGKLENRVAGFTASGVSSFNTRTGSVTLTSGDVTGALGFSPSPDTHTHPASSITNTPVAPITSTNVQGALNEVASLADSASSAASTALSTANSAASAATYADALARSSYNLIKNGNGEMLNPTGYEAAGVAGSTGSKYRYLYGGGPGAYSKLQVMADITVTPGEKFLMSWDAAAGTGPVGTASANAGIEAWFEGVDAYNTANGYGYPQMLVDSFTNKRFTQEITVPAGAKALHINLITYNVPTNVSFTFDNLYLGKKVGTAMLEDDAVRSTTHAFAVSDTTASTSTTTGAIVAAGGIATGDCFTGRYRSQDGSAGITATRTFYAASTSGGAVNVLNTVTIKDGIITAWTQA